MYNINFLTIDGLNSSGSVICKIDSAGLLYLLQEAFHEGEEYGRLQRVLLNGLCVCVGIDDK